MIYPTECAKIKRKNTFSVDAKLFPARVKEEQNPLEIYDARWSRFILSIIETGKGSVSVNVPVRDVPLILKRSDIAQEQQITSVPATASAEDTQNNPAYTVRISTGRLKGKTPAEVLLEDPEGGKVLLNTQYAFLEKNADKYPKNREQMQAIAEAAKLQKSGKLKAQSVVSGIPIYKVDIKSLKNRKKANGKCFTYSVDVHWETGETYPLVVSMENYYAYVDDSNGMIKVDVSSKEDYKAQTFRMTPSEWANVCYQISANMRIFENRYGNECLAESKNAENEARQLAGIPIRA